MSMNSWTNNCEFLERKESKGHTFAQLDEVANAFFIFHLVGRTHQLGSDPAVCVALVVKERPAFCVVQTLDCALPSRVHRNWWRYGAV